MQRDGPKKLPTLNESSEKKLEMSSFNDSFSKYQMSQLPSQNKSKLTLEKN
jgi:hypothetical protein